MYLDNNASVADRNLSAGREPELSTRSNKTLVLLSSTATTTNVQLEITLSNNALLDSTIYNPAGAEPG